MQGGGWQGWLAGIMIGAVAVAGGCGSPESGTQVNRTQAQTEGRAAARKVLAEQKKQAMAEGVKGQTQGRRTRRTP